MRPWIDESGQVIWLEGMLGTRRWFNFLYDGNHHWMVLE